MKKYITLAALIAAGGACVHAATLVASYDFNNQDLKSSTTSDSDGAAWGSEHSPTSEFSLRSEGDYALKFTDNDNSGFYRDGFGTGASCSSLRDASIKKCTEGE